MPEQRDGGRAALGGFLYQILGVLGLRAGVEKPISEADPLDALMSIDPGVRIIHERFDSDGVIEPVEGGISLLQFKYSGVQPPETLPESEYVEIVKSMHAAKKRVEKSGKVVTFMYLITNRRIDKDKVKRFHYIAERELHEKLEIKPGLDPSYWEGKLFGFGRQFGSDEEEIQRGINELVGQLVRGKDTVERDDLVKAMTGSENTTSIQQSDIQGRMVEDLKGVLRGVCRLGDPLRRSQWDDLRDAIYRESRAFVALLGDGGNGKSTALADWLLERLDRENRHRPCVSVRVPDSGAPSWLGTIVAEWSNLPPNLRRRDEDSDRVLQRIVIANQDLAHPVLILGLDGLDERVSIAIYRDALQRIFRWFRLEDISASREGRAPRASLIVTSREYKDIKSLLAIASPGFEPDWEPAKIQFGDFTEESLRELARASVPRYLGRFPSGGALETRKPNQARGLTDTVDDPAAGSVSGGELDERSIDALVLESLKHPSMWGEFSLLGDEELQGRILDGEQVAVDSLARRFTRWFCEKLEKRRDHPDPDAAKRALSQIAIHTQMKAGPYQPIEDWCTPARGTGLSENHAHDLLKEAVSAGYVRLTPERRWNWRHPICTPYLCGWSPWEEV